MLPDLSFIVAHFKETSFAIQDISTDERFSGCGINNAELGESCLKRKDCEKK